MATYTYFRKSGKYYAEGKGVDLPINGNGYTRNDLVRLNSGGLPGLSPGSIASDFIIVVTDDEQSFPRLFPVLERW